MRCEGAENPPCKRCRQQSLECLFEKPNREASLTGEAGLECVLSLLFPLAHPSPSFQADSELGDPCHGYTTIANSHSKYPGGNRQPPTRISRYNALSFRFPFHVHASFCGFTRIYVNPRLCASTARYRSCYHVHSPTRFISASVNISSQFKPFDLQQTDVC